MRRVSFVALALLFFALDAHAVTGTCDAVPLAAVEVESSAGSAAGIPKSYGNLGAAFAAINAGLLHNGEVSIDICANVSEGTTPATLNSSGAGSASYASISIRPVATGLTISGNPASGFGVIQLNGADNVTIDGDDPNVAGTNRDLTIVNTAAPAVTANSVIRIATSTAVTSADGNTFKNLVLNGNVTSGNAVGITSGSTVDSYGIYVGGGGGVTATTAPTAITGAPPAPFASTVNNLLVDNNAINQCAIGVRFYFAGESSTNLTITNNTIGAGGTPTPAIPPYTWPTSTVYTTGIAVSDVKAVTIAGNTIRNIMSYAVANWQHSAISLSDVSSGGVSISNNTISGVVANAAGRLGARGISLQVRTPYVISGNQISDVQSFCDSVFWQSGIFVYTPSIVGGIIERNTVTKIYNRNPGTFGAVGIDINTANNPTVRNNFISDVNQDMSGGAGFSTSRGVIGLRVANSAKVYHNTVNLFGALLGTPSSNQLTAAFVNLSSSDVRNNVFANTMTGGTTSIAHVATYLSASLTASTSLIWNNNAYFTGSTPGVHGICQVGTTYTPTPVGPPSFAGLYTAADFDPQSIQGAANLRSYTSGLRPLDDKTNDNGSFATTSAPPFVSNTDLHIPAATVTELESLGAAIGVSNDIDDEMRNSSMPDVGADEFDGVAVDISAPSVIYVPLSHTTAVSNRILIVDVADALSGVPTSGIGLPVIYFRKGTGGLYSSKPCAYTGGSTYSCEIDYSLVSGGSVTTGDTVQYYVAAQDAAEIPNVAVEPWMGVADRTANPPAAGTPPTSPNSYVISSMISGTYYVGTSETFTSLTNPGGIFEFLSTNAFVGNVTVEITSDLTAETGSRALDQWIEEGVGGYTLTIKPSGSARTVSGTSTGATALIKLNGADRVTIDGSLMAPTGTERSLTIRNNNASGVVIWIASAGASNGASNNVVQNCNISGSSSAITIRTYAGIIAAAGNSFLLGAEAPNSNNVIRNNGISAVQRAVSIRGVATTRDQNWVVSENNIASVNCSGLEVGNAQNFLIKRNQISAVSPYEGSSPGASLFGVSIGSVSGGMIEANTIGPIAQLHDSGTFLKAYGIYVNTGNLTSALTIRNNVIADVFSVPGGCAGVLILGSTGGVSLYHNSVNLFGSHFGSNNQTQPALEVGGSVVGLDVRNNVFRNAYYSDFDIGPISFAVRAPVSAFTLIDSNAYFTPNDSTFALGQLSGSNVYTMAAWKAATGQDSHSLDPAVDPSFVSNTNLRPNFGSPIVHAGQPIGVLTDITGATRSATSPSMGAYEQPKCSAGTVCNDNSPCTNDTCVLTGDAHCESTPLPEGSSCGDPDNGACNAPDTCNPTGACVDRKKPAATVCLPGDTSGCNPNDVCDGVTNACVAIVASDLSGCGNPDATDCNAADSCDAVGHCIDRKKAANVLCRSASGDCDVDDVCDGVSNVCPPEYQASTVECRASTDVCDPAELCSGFAATCPSDVVDASAPVGNSVRVSHDPATEESTVSWDEPVPGPFNVYRGARMNSGPWVYNQTCDVGGATTQSTTDTDTPALGEMFFFLVSRDDATCPESSLGPDSAGSARPNQAACSP